MSRRHISADIWHLVQFIEDDIWYVCPPIKIKSMPNGYSVRWKDGKWYAANVYKTGDKETMEKIKRQMEVDRNINISKGGEDCNKKRTNQMKKRRRMCNVNLDLSDNTLTDKMEHDFYYHLNIDKSKIDLVNNTVEMVNLGGEPDSGVSNQADFASDNNTELTADLVTPVNESKRISIKETEIIFSKAKNFKVSKTTKVCTTKNKNMDSEETNIHTTCEPFDPKNKVISHVSSSKSNSMILEEEKQSPLVLTELKNMLLTPSFQPLEQEQNLIHNKVERSCKTNVCYAEENEESPFHEEESLYDPSFTSNEFSSDFNFSDSQSNRLSKELQTDIANMPDSSPSENIHENVLDYPNLQIAVISSTDKRKWDKKFLCPFCQKLYCKLPRHMYNSHSQEKEVALILSLDKNSKERNLLIQSLENRGMFLRNKTAIKEGEGIIMPKRRIHIKQRKYLTDYAPCTYCFQMFSKSYLYRHVKSCKFSQKKNEDFKLTRNRSLLANSILMLPIGPTMSKSFKECILCKMTADDVFNIVRTDQLILLFGETEFKRLGHDKRYHRNIIDRCRELGRLVQKAKELDKNIKKLKDLINPSKYKIFRDAVFKVSGYNSETNNFKTPSLALKIGYTIKKCISVLKGEYLEDEILRTDIPNLDIFLQILESKWHIDVTSHAHRTLAERKWNAPKRIPLTRDIQILHKYLCKERDIYYTELSKQSCVKAFQKLTELTLVLVIMLNRRRVGDVQHTPLDIYKKATGVDSESDVFETLSETEKQLAKCFQRLVIRGKRGRGVPILLTNDMQRSINLLINRRVACGLDESNNYLFPSLRNACGFYRASDLIASFAKRAGCEFTDTITSTKLRKHVSTMVQLLNLKDHELDALAQFLGHDIRVHRKHYRLQDETVQLAKISKLLINFSNGALNSMKGKSLDEIEVNDFSENELENDNEEINTLECETLRNDKIEKKTTELQKNIEKRVIERDILGKKGRSGRERKSITKQKWSIEEANLVSTNFKDFLFMKKLPGKKLVEEFLNKNKEIIKNRTWRNVKDFLYAKLKKM